VPGPSLTKWYLDGVTSAGDVLVGYAGELRVAGVRIPWSEWTLFAASGSIERRAVWRRCDPVAGPAGCVQWSAPALSLDGTWQRTIDPAVPAVLLHETADTRIGWESPAVAADVALRVGRRALTARGYVERLTLALPRWQFPISELRWGRFVGATDSLVWISWRGPVPLARCWRNGVACGSLELFPAGVRTIGTELAFGDGRVLREAPLDAGALAGVGMWRHLLPPRVRKIHESRSVCRGRLTAPGGRSDEGWVVHERIAFP
jgi:hypothetical protein